MIQSYCAGCGVKAYCVVAEEPVDISAVAHFIGWKVLQVGRIEQCYAVAELHGDVELMGGEKHTFLFLVGQFA